MPLQDIETYHASAHLRRRGAIALVGGSAVAYTATYVAATFLPKQFNVSTVVLEDPQEPVPCGGLKPPNPHPNVVGTPSAPQPTAAATSASAGGLPRPSGARTLGRDKDGAVVPSGRPAGQLATAITSNSDFYVVTNNAGGDPSVKPEDWRLPDRR